MLKRIYKELKSILLEPYFDRLVASMTVMTALAVSPFIAILLSISKVYGQLGSYVERLRPLILDSLSAGVGDNFLSGMDAAVSNLRAETLGSFAFLFLLWTSTRLIHEVDSSIKTIWREKSKRSWWRRILVYWLFLFIGPLVLSIVLGVVNLEALAGVRNALGPGVFVALLTLGLSLIFYYGPSTRVLYVHSALAAFITSMLLVGGQKLFVYSSSNLLRYNEIYGSLAILPLFLIWIMIIWYIFLFGVSLSKAFHEARPKP